MLIENELTILLRCNYKINQFSSFEICALYFTNLFDDFDINLINSNRNPPKSINIFQFSMLVFEMSFSQYEINSKFPEDIILISSMFSILEGEKEFNKYNKLKNIVNTDLNEIYKCTELINMIINDKEEGEGNYYHLNKNFTFLDFLKNMDFKIEGKIIN